MSYTEKEYSIDERKTIEEAGLPSGVNWSNDQLMTFATHAPNRALEYIIKCGSGPRTRPDGASWKFLPELVTYARRELEDRMELVLLTASLPK